MDNLGKVKRRKVHYCQRCGKEIASKTANFCIECSRLKTRKCDRPNREELKAMIKSTPFTQIARSYHVTDNAIRKWCDDYNLPRKVREIKKYNDQEWEKI